MPVNKKKKAKKEAEATKAPAGKTISVANLCRELGVDPKKGRARMRKHDMSASGGRYPDLIVGSKEYDEVKELVTS